MVLYYMLINIVLDAVSSHADANYDLKKMALQTEKHLLKEVSVFDVFEGDKLPAGKKSYALSFVLQDAEKTLTDTEIDKVMEKLIKTFEKEAGAEIRKA